ncbi:MAG: hypothetical protein ACK56W_01505 [Pirellula sp.]|jgi:hypothetical protein
MKTIDKSARVSSLVFVMLASISCSAIAQQRPERNPFLSADIYGVTHINPAKQNSIPYKIPLKTQHIDLETLVPVWGGPVNNSTYASATPGYFWSVSTDRIALIDARGKSWKTVADIDLPGARRRSLDALNKIVRYSYSDMSKAEEHLKSILGDAPGSIMPAGIYALVSNEDLVYANAGTIVSAIGRVDPNDVSKGLKVVAQFDTATIIPPTSVFGEEPRVGLVGMNMTYDGHLVIGALNGIAVIDTAFTNGRFQSFGDDNQMATNSLAVDKDGGIYVATGSKKPRLPGVMHKFVWTGNSISKDEKDGAWKAQYDGGDWPPAIKAGTGTGSTPTLMGFGDDDDKLVLITDGSNRMKLVAFWRVEIPADARRIEGALSPRIADQKPVTAGISEQRPWLQSEQTVPGRGVVALPAVFDRIVFVVRSVCCRLAELSLFCKAQNLPLPTLQENWFPHQAWILHWICLQKARQYYSCCSRRLGLLRQPTTCNRMRKILEHLDR